MKGIYKALLVGFFLIPLGLQAQLSEVEVQVNWPNWSSDNEVSIYDPSGNLMLVVCDPVNCKTTTSNSSYIDTFNLGCFADANNYYLVATDAYGDGWNGTSPYVRVYTGGNLAISYDLASGSTSGQQFFNVSGGGTCPTDDAGLLFVDVPANGCGLSVSETITATIINQGTANITSCPVFYRINGGGWTSAGSYSGTLTSGNTANFNFNVDLSAFGSYTIDVYLALSGDANTSNDTVTGSSVTNTQHHDFASGELTMGFESTEDLTGWLVIDANSDGDLWDMASTTNERTGTQCATYNYNASNAANDWMYTKCLSLSAGSTYELEYYYRVRSASYPEDMEVVITSAQDGNSGSVISTIETLTDFTNTAYALSSNTFTVGSSGTYYISWHAISDADEWDIHIDDILIREVVDDDARVLSIDGPDPACGLTATEQVSITIENLGNNAFSSCPIEYNLDNAGWVSAGSYSGASVASGATTTYTFDIDLSVPGAHTLDVRTQLAGDGLPGNDAATGHDATHIAPFDFMSGVVSMGFEEADDFEGNAWATLDNNSDGADWNIENIQNVHSGSRAAVYDYSAANAADDWIFTSCLDLDANRTYVVSYEYRVRSATYPEALQVHIVSSQSAGSVVSTIETLTNLQNTAYVTSTNTFTVGASGTYYLAWECNSNADQWQLYIDDILIRDEATVWLGNSTDWTLSTNWTNGVPAVTTSAFIPASPAGGNAPTISTNQNINDLELEAGANITMTSSGTLNVYGNWTGGGAFDPGDGEVIFRGSSAQTISGDNIWSTLDINNSNGVSLSSGAQTLEDQLQMNDGVFDVSGGSFTLISDGTHQGRIGAIASGASVTGDVTVERYVDAPSGGWHLLGSPVTGTTLQDWYDDFYTSGFSGSHSPLFTFTSLYWYDETIVDSDIQVGFTAPNDINQNIDLTAYWAYLGPAPITVDVTGPIHQGNTNLGVTYSTAGAATAADGWNIVINPFPCDIDWAGSGWTKTNINNEVHIWDPVTNQYASYISGASTNGGSRYIASSQAFYVKANAASPVLAVDEDAKYVAGTATFRNNDEPNILSSLKFEMLGFSGTKDETVVRLVQGAQPEYDAAFDASKLYSSSPYVPSLATVLNDTTDASINSFGELTEDLHIPVRAKAWYSGNYTLNISGAESLPLTSCVFLEDLETGQMLDLRTDTNYTFFLADTAEAPRFLLHISAPIETDASPVSCHGDQDGEVVATGQGNGPWIYHWYQNGSLIHTDQSANSTSTLSNLAPGAYTVQVQSLSGLCPAAWDTAIVYEPSPVVAAFSPSATAIDLAYTDVVEFTNRSVNADDYFWTFGDGQSSTIEDPIHYYQQAGVYAVELEATKDGCSSTIQQQVTVSHSQLTDVNEVTAQEAITLTQSGSSFVLDFDLEQPEQASIRITDQLGRSVGAIEQVNAWQNRHTIDLSGQATGVYFLEVTTGDDRASWKIVPF